ncbi:MAG: BatD family protein [Candidatus Sumerlaeia bacterium]|nr:BatD family protein [Candidatus Sumerlaeia bacterium]
MVALSGFARAATTETLRVEATTPKSEYRIGDQIEYTVTVEWQAPVELVRVEPSMALGVFEILQSPEVSRKRIGRGWQRETTRYLLSTFETGEYVIPEFTIIYRDTDGSEKRVPTPPVKIVVQSVAPVRPDDTGIREAKPPVLPPYRLSAWQWAAIGAAVFFAGLVAAALIVRALRKRRGEAAPAVPPRPIEDVAREDLARIAQSDLLERGLIKEYFDAVSDVIRQYLGRRYGFIGIATTTSELIEALREPLSNDGRLALVSEFSEEADLAKFAKWRPDRAVCEHFLQTAYRVIEETTPKAEPAKTES